MSSRDSHPPAKGRRSVLQGRRMLLGIVILAVVIAGTLTALSFNGRGATRKVSSQIKACLRPQSFAPVRRVGPFMEVYDRVISAFPSKGRLPGRSAPLFQTTFLGGRKVAALAKVTMTQPYYSEERQHAEELGYRMGRWPLTPLSGAVVAETPGPLEIYQVHYVFSASSGASSLIRSLWLSNGALGPDGSDVRPVAITGSTGAYEFSGWLVPGSVTAEHVVGAGFSFGNSLVQVLIAGGSQVIPKRVSAIIRKVVEAARVCMDILPN